MCSSKKIDICAESLSFSLYELIVRLVIPTDPGMALFSLFLNHNRHITEILFSQPETTMQKGTKEGSNGDFISGISRQKMVSDHNNPDFKGTRTHTNTKQRLSI
jgi:hypothetical protein